MCHGCALDRLPSWAAGLTCRGLPWARTGVPGWLLAAGCLCARGKDAHGWTVPATLAFMPGYPLCIRDLGARHPPARGTVALVMDGKGSGCRAPLFSFKPLGGLVVGLSSSPSRSALSFSKYFITRVSEPSSGPMLCP